jgi:hypothetical protein
MKVSYRNMLNGYAGTCDGLVYYFNRRIRRYVARPWAKPRTTEGNLRFGRIAANLKLLCPSDGFKGDLRIYNQIYNDSFTRGGMCLQNWYIAFNRMMWKLAESYPGIDLETINREQIIQLDLPCRNIRRAVESGLLEPVNGFELLIREL